jgi:hypothetical protein
MRPTLLLIALALGMLCASCSPAPEQDERYLLLSVQNASGKDVDEVRIELNEDEGIANYSYDFAQAESSGSFASQRNQQVLTVPLPKGMTEVDLRVVGFFEGEQATNESNVTRSSYGYVPDPVERQSVTLTRLSQKLGTACKTSDTCSSGFCVDGVCCQTACAGTCRTCNMPERLGSCVSVPRGQSDPDTCAAPSTCDFGSTCQAF